MHQIIYAVPYTNDRLPQNNIVSQNSSGFIEVPSHLFLLLIYSQVNNHLQVRMECTDGISFGINGTSPQTKLTADGQFRENVFALGNFIRFPQGLRDCSLAGFHHVRS